MPWLLYLYGSLKITVHVGVEGRAIFRWDYFCVYIQLLVNCFESNGKPNAIYIFFPSSLKCYF